MHTGLVAGWVGSMTLYELSTFCFSDRIFGVFFIHDFAWF